MLQVSWLQVAVFCVSLITAVSTAAFAFQTRRTALRSLAQPALLKLLEEFRSAEFKKAHTFVCQELPRRHTWRDLDDLPDDERARVMSVMHFYDHLALLVKARIVRRKEIVAFMGDSICRTWLALEPFITNRREGGKDYQAFFEDLAVRAARPSQSKVLRRFRLRRFADNEVLRNALEGRLLGREAGGQSRH
jgi:hypothetical protein